MRYNINTIEKLQNINITFIPNYSFSNYKDYTTQPLFYGEREAPNPSAQSIGQYYVTMPPKIIALYMVDVIQNITHTCLCDRNTYIITCCSIIILCGLIVIEFTKGLVFKQ